MAMVSTPSSTPEEPAVSPPSAAVPELPESAVSPELPVPPQAARDAVMARAISKVNNLFMFLHLSQRRFRGGHRPPPRPPPAAERTKNGPLCQAVHGKYGKKPRQGRSRTAIDSASQRFVTVRQVFPDDPAPEGQASSRHFGGGPFPTRRLPGLAGAVLMNAAPLSERSNFEGILSRSRGDVNARFQKNAKNFADLCRS